MYRALSALSISSMACIASLTMPCTLVQSNMQRRSPTQTTLPSRTTDALRLLRCRLESLGCQTIDLEAQGLVYESRRDM